MDANDRQVAGNHYQTGGLQHWDVVQIFDLDYFQGQITKYLFRWKKKHDTPAERLDDLKKAAHFLEKYIEIAENAVPATTILAYGVPCLVRTQDLAPSAYLGFTYEGGDKVNDYFRCRACRDFIVRKTGVPPTDHVCNGAAPTRAYVNQDGSAGEKA